ncbi:MAG: DUF2179 domain-containing protein [Kiritimatiellia bacterium]|nr:DUF2179 domain-containing protein [Kiritimatiellia bacterium]
MNWSTAFASEQGWILPLLIFVARITDVSLGTLRLNFVSQGRKLLAPLIGFFEVIIWITVIAQIVKHMDNWMSFVAYAAGYAVGTYVGMQLEERLALGTVLVRVIPQHDAGDLVDRLRENGYGVTQLAAEGAGGPVKVLLTLVRRSHLPDVLQTVRAFNPNAFFTVEDVRQINQGIFPSGIGLRGVMRPGK